jgi:hypothetical protein
MSVGIDPAMHGLFMGFVVIEFDYSDDSALYAKQVAVKLQRAGTYSQAILVLPVLLVLAGVASSSLWVYLHHYLNGCVCYAWYRLSPSSLQA